MVTFNVLDFEKPSTIPRLLVQKNKLFKIRSFTCLNEFEKKTAAQEIPE